MISAIDARLAATPGTPVPPACVSRLLPLLTLTLSLTAGLLLPLTRLQLISG
jgi:hypothetical protein